MHRFQRWRSAIQGARHVADLERIVRDYASCIPPDQVRQLPEDCRAVLAQAGEDVSGAAVTLVRAELHFAGELATSELLHEIAQTFAAAAARQRQLVAAASDAAATLP